MMSYYIADGRMLTSKRGTPYVLFDEATSVVLAGILVTDQPSDDEILRCLHAEYDANIKQAILAEVQVAQEPVVQEPVVLMSIRPDVLHRLLGKEETDIS